MTHLHYIVWAYERVEPTTGNYVDYVAVDLIAVNESHAIGRARGLINKPNYRVSQIIEHVDGQPCGKG